jgi:hypothetical protein
MRGLTPAAADARVIAGQQHTVDMLQERVRPVKYDAETAFDASFNLHRTYKHVDSR